MQTAGVFLTVMFGNRTSELAFSGFVDDESHLNINLSADLSTGVSCVLTHTPSHENHVQTTEWRTKQKKKKIQTMRLSLQPWASRFLKLRSCWCWSEGATVENRQLSYPVYRFQFTFVTGFLDLRKSFRNRRFSFCQIFFSPSLLHHLTWETKRLSRKASFFGLWAFSICRIKSRLIRKTNKLLFALCFFCPLSCVFIYLPL